MNDDSSTIYRIMSYCITFAYQIDQRSYIDILLATTLVSLYTDVRKIDEKAYTKSLKMKGTLQFILTKSKS